MLRPAPAHHTTVTASLFEATNLRIGLNAPSFDLSLKKGETLVLLGTDMGALSVLFDMIAGFQPSFGAAISVNGVDITERPLGQRKLSLVSEREDLFFHLSVRANINFACRAQKEDKGTAAAHTNHLLSLLGLDDVAEHRPKALNNERIFRVKLAQALARKPELLLLDAPFSNLDKDSSRRIEALLRRLQRALNLTIIRSEERQDIALRAGSTIALFQGQTLMQTGSAATLYEQPQTPNVATLFGDANALVGQIIDDYNDVYTVHLACGGTVEATAPRESTADLNIGDACVVCVRPDRISPYFGKNTLLDDEDRLPLRGTLTEALHLGDHIRMRVRCDDGTEIELHRPPLQAQKIPSNGVSAELAWPAAHALAFPLETYLD